MTPHIDVRRFGVVIAIVGIYSAACGTPDTPTAPSALPASRLAAAAESTPAPWPVSSMGSGLGACLGGLGGAACFNADRVRAADVSAAPVASAPLSLAATVSGSTVFLMWTAPAFQDAPVTSYIVEAASTPNFAVPNLANFDTGTPLSALTAPGVPPGTYYVRVRARNALGVSAPSNEIQVVVAGGGGGAGAGCPSAPRSLTATAPASGAVLLTWLAPLSGTAQSYVVQAGSSPGLSNLANFNTGNAGMTFSSGGIPPGTYYVRVIAVASGCPTSPASNEVTFVSGAAAPAPGGAHMVTVTLSYTCAPCSTDPDNYALYVCPTGGRCSGVRATSPPRSPNTLTVNAQLAPGTHHVEVRATRFTGSWTLAFRSPPPVTGGVVPNSFRLVVPPSSPAFMPAGCSITGRLLEAFLSFEVRAGAAGVC